MKTADLHPEGYLRINILCVQNSSKVPREEIPAFHFYLHYAVTLVETK